MGDKVRAAAAGLSQALDEVVTEVHSRAGQVKRMRDELEEEKRMMSSLPSNRDVGAEVLEINVGGEIFVTKRSTLLSAEGSLLAAMFSGRWEDSLDRDKDGRVFLDFDPAPFRLLLNVLRMRRIKEPGKVRWPRAQPEHEEMFEAMVGFLGLQDAKEDSTVCRDEALVCVRAGCKDRRFSTGGSIISSNPSSLGYRPVVGATTLLEAKAPPDTSVAWRVVLRKLEPDTDWVYAGIVGVPAPRKNSCSDPTSYGWGSESQTFAAGLVSDTGVELQAGDNLVFLLEGAQRRLRMALERTGEIRTMQLPEGMAEEARLHLNLIGGGAEVQVSKATLREAARAGLL